MYFYWCVTSNDETFLQCSQILWNKSTSPSHCVIRSKEGVKVHIFFFTAPAFSREDSEADKIFIKTLLRTPRRNKKKKKEKGIAEDNVCILMSYWGLSRLSKLARDHFNLSNSVLAMQYNNLRTPFFAIYHAIRLVQMGLKVYKWSRRITCKVEAFFKKNNSKHNF